MSANLFTSVQDLVNDALWLAGETNNVNGLFYQRAIDYLNAVYVALIAGGTLGDRTLPAIDWWWARSAQRGQILVTAAYNSTGNPSGGNALTLTNGSTIATFASPPVPVLQGFYVLVNQFSEQTPRIVNTQGANVIVLDQPWQGTTQTTSNYFVARFDYPLPQDFLRFNGPILMDRWPYEIIVTSTPAMEHVWPRGQVFAGTPELASVVTMNPPTVRFNRYPIDNNFVTEFEYISKPSTLVVGGPEPEVPFMHRRILSIGAGYLMLVDKIDARSNQIFTQFITAWEGMQSDHGKQVNSDTYGRILTRPTRIVGSKQLLRTTSGIIIG